jgi:hypothetical protein
MDRRVLRTGGLVHEDVEAMTVCGDCEYSSHKKLVALASDGV